MARTASELLQAALDRSRAGKIALVDEGSGSEPIHVPPQALRMFATILKALSERKVLTIIPHEANMTTLEAARFLNVSRPFVIKEIDAGRLPCHKVGTHRRIPFEALVRYKGAFKARQADALQGLADEAQAMGLY